MEECTATTAKKVSGWVEYNVYSYAQLGINSRNLSNYIKLHKMEETSKNNETAQLGIGGVSISALTEILKSDSVYTLLRFGVKSPSKSGMDDCDDDDYYNLYQLVCELRKH